MRSCTDCGAKIAPGFGRPRKRCVACSPPRSPATAAARQAVGPVAGGGSVLEGVRRDISLLPAGMQPGGLARLALQLARAVDDRPTALVAKELRECLAALAAQAKESAAAPREASLQDDLAAARAAREASAGG